MGYNAGMTDPLHDPDFLWGASTAAHQVEGGLHNQWTEWELAHAERLAADAPKNLAWLPGLERISDQATDPANYISGTAVEHFARYKADFDLLKELNLNAFRFGIEWSRIEPEEGRWDDAALAHYAGYIAELKQRGIEPIPTLWHWTMPIWLADKGGFAKRRNLQYFARYVTKVSELFGSDVRYVLTINEPNAYAPFSYLTGMWPPQRKNPLVAAWVFYNLARAHRLAYRVLKTVKPELQVGIAYNLVELRPHNPSNYWNRLLAGVLRYISDWWFLDRIWRTSDFIGVNYYFTEYRDWRGRQRNPRQPVSDLGWYMEPCGLGRLLISTWRRYRKPLMITENGLADSDDQYRRWWLSETVEALREARHAGAHLIGYLHWSLLDNFEWAFGWWPKFGLVAVDREHGMKRTVRPSARWFAKQVAAARRRS